jgi:hypothetical protein
MCTATFFITGIPVSTNVVFEWLRAIGRTSHRDSGDEIGVYRHGMAFFGDLSFFVHGIVILECLAWWMNGVVTIADTQRLHSYSIDTILHLGPCTHVTCISSLEFVSSTVSPSMLATGTYSLVYRGRTI